MSYKNNLKIIKKMEDRMSDIQVELILMEESYKVFPDPSEQLDKFNVLNDEYWRLYQEIEAINRDNE